MIGVGDYGCPVRENDSIALVVIHRFGRKNYFARFSVITKNIITGFYISHGFPTVRSWNRRVNGQGFPILFWNLQVRIAILPVSILFYRTVNIPKDLILPIQQLKRLPIKVINRVKHLHKLYNFKRALLVMSHSHHACSGTAPSEILSFPRAVASELP